MNSDPELVVGSDSSPRRTAAPAPPNPAPASPKHAPSRLGNCVFNTTLLNLMIEIINSW
jgi:hypothetical protein